MGGDQDPLAVLDLGDDVLVPEGQGAGDGVLQALAGRELVLRQVAVATVLQGGQWYVGVVWTFRLQSTFLFLLFYYKCVCDEIS